MRKNLYFFASVFMMAALSLFLVSCGDDDDVTEASVVGTWEVTYVKASSSYGIDDNEGLQVGDRMTFYADGKYEDSEGVGRWTQNGSTLTVVIDDDESIPAIMKITKLTNSVLEVKLDYGSFMQFEIKMKRVS